MIHLNQSRLPLIAINNMMMPIVLLIVSCSLFSSLVSGHYDSSEEELTQPNRLDEASSNFVCSNEGYFADVTYGCQYYHVCGNSNSPFDKPTFVKHTFSCVNGTVFNQMSFTCTRHQDSIPCESSPNYFYLNKRNGDPKAHFLTDEDIVKLPKSSHNKGNQNSNSNNNKNNNNNNQNSGGGYNSIAEDNSQDNDNVNIRLNNYFASQSSSSSSSSPSYSQSLPSSSSSSSPSYSQSSPSSSPSSSLSYSKYSSSSSPTSSLSYSKSSSSSLPSSSLSYSKSSSSSPSSSLSYSPSYSSSSSSSYSPSSQTSSELSSPISIYPGSVSSNSVPVRSSNSNTIKIIKEGGNTSSGSNGNSYSSEIDHQDQDDYNNDQQLSRNEEPNSQVLTSPIKYVDVSNQLYDTNSLSSNSNSYSQKTTAPVEVSQKYYSPHMIKMPGVKYSQKLNAKSLDKYQSNNRKLIGYSTINNRNNNNYNNNDKLDIRIYPSNLEISAANSKNLESSMSNNQMPATNSYKPLFASKIDQILAKSAESSLHNQSPQKSFQYQSQEGIRPNQISHPVHHQSSKKLAFTPAAFSKMYMENQNAAKYSQMMPSHNSNNNIIHATTESSPTSYNTIPESNYGKQSNYKQLTSVYSPISLTTQQFALPSSKPQQQSEHRPQEPKQSTTSSMFTSHAQFPQSYFSSTQSQSSKQPQKTTSFTRHTEMPQENYRSTNPYVVPQSVRIIHQGGSYQKSSQPQQHQLLDQDSVPEEPHQQQQPQQPQHREQTISVQTAPMTFTNKQQNINQNQNQNINQNFNHNSNQNLNHNFNHNNNNNQDFIHNHKQNINQDGGSSSSSTNNNQVADYGDFRVVKQVKGKSLLIDPSLDKDPARDNIIAQVLEMLNKYN